MDQAIIINDHDRIKVLKHADFDLLHINEGGQRVYDGTLPHRHTFYELFFFERKGNVHEIDFRQYPVEAHSVHFVSPAQVHRLEHRKGNGILLCFNEIFLKRPDRKKIPEIFPFYALNASQPLINLSKPEFTEISAYVSLIAREFFSGSASKFEVISSLLNSLLLKLKEFYLASLPEEGQVTAIHHPLVLGFIAEIEKNFERHLSVQEYADRLSISPNYLNALCKKEIGRTAVSLLHERLLLEAKRLLYSTLLSAKEISAKLGFEDTAYFNRFFKKMTGQTPLRFRQTPHK